MSEFKPTSGQGMIGSWASDRAEGFSDEDIAALLRIQESLAVAAKIAVKGELAHNMLTTYLGAGAGASRATRCRKGRSPLVSQRNTEPRSSE